MTAGHSPRELTARLNGLLRDALSVADSLAVVTATQTPAEAFLGMLLANADDEGLSDASFRAFVKLGQCRDAQGLLSVLADKLGVGRLVSLYDSELSAANDTDLSHTLSALPLPLFLGDLSEALEACEVG